MIGLTWFQHHKIFVFTFKIYSRCQKFGPTLCIECLFLFSDDCWHHSFSLKTTFKHTWNYGGGGVDQSQITRVLYLKSLNGKIKFSFIYIFVLLLSSEWKMEKRY